MCKVIVHLHHHEAGYVERLRTLNEQLKASVASLENRVASGDEESRRSWNAYQNGLAEVRQLKEQIRILNQPNDYAKLERYYDDLRDRFDELSRQNIALAAQAEQSELLERQLAAADRENAELEAALRLAQMPADSQNNVIELLKRAA